MKNMVLLSLALIALLWPFALKRTNKHTEKSLSYHMAATTSSIRFGKIVIPIAIISLGVWYFGWYIPTYAPTILLTILMVIMMVSCLTLAFVPYYVGTIRGLIHNIASYGGYAALMPFVITGMAYYSRNSVAKLCIVGIACTMVLLAVLPKINRNVWHYFLYFQAGYIMLFGAGLIIVTYVT